MGVARRSQGGYALLVVLLVLSLFVLSLAKLIPSWSTQIQRERESRSIDHAREYRTAIKRYFHKYGRYPPSLAILAQKDGQGIRYLRQMFPDPLTASADDEAGGGANSDNGDTGWQVIHYGQAVSAEIVDQPPAAALAAGNTVGGIAGPGLSSGTQGAGITSSGAGALGGLGMGGQAIGGQDLGGPGMPGGGAASGIAGAQGGPGTSTGLPAISSGPGATGNSASATSGGPVIGVASLSKKSAVHEFNGFDIPNDWQFVYNYAQDPTLRAGAGGGATTSGTGLTPTQVPTPTTGPGHN